MRFSLNMLRLSYIRRITVITAAIIAVFLAAAVGLAEEKPPIQKQTQRKGPVVITSDTLSAEAARAVFEGNVVAKTDDITLKAKKMYVYYTSGNKVQRIEAEG